MSLAQQIAEVLAPSRIGMYPLQIAERIGADIPDVSRELDRFVRAGVAEVRRYSQRVILISDDITPALERKRRESTSKRRSISEIYVERVYEALSRRGRGRGGVVSFRRLCRRVGEDHRNRVARQRVHRALRRLLAAERVEHVGLDQWRAI